MADENVQPEINTAEDDVEELPDFTKKHPLERKWTLWYDPKKRDKVSWAEALRPVCSVSTIEEFWCLFNNILPPTVLDEKADLKFFQDGVNPDWDDKETASGGIWSVPIKRTADAKDKLEQYWMDVVLHLLGEQFEHSEDVIGVSCNIRKSNDRIEVWTKTASNEAMQTSIGKQLKQLLKLPSSVTIGFVSHEQAKGQQRKTGAKEDTYTA